MNIKDQLNLTLEKFEHDSLGEHYKGKVRDNYYHEDKIINHEPEYSYLWKNHWH